MHRSISRPSRSATRVRSCSRSTRWHCMPRSPMPSSSRCRTRSTCPLVRACYLARVASAGHALQSLMSASVTMALCPSHESFTIAGAPVGADSYQRRAWCRAEQFCYSIGHGSDNLWLASSPDLADIKLADIEWLNTCLFVFEGVWQQHAFICGGSLQGTRCASLRQFKLLNSFNPFCASSPFIYCSSFLPFLPQAK